MKQEELSDIECMLVVIYKKLDDMERRTKGSSKLASISSYYDELKKDAKKVKAAIKNL